MINWWLYTLPNVGVALLFGLVGAVSFAATPFLREKLWRNGMRSEHSDAASSAFSVVIGFTGLVPCVLPRSGADFLETIICLVAILLLLATFSEATFGRAIALLAEGFGLALLMALVFIFDQPFKGQTSV